MITRLTKAWKLFCEILEVKPPDGCRRITQLSTNASAVSQIWAALVSIILIHATTATTWYRMVNRSHWKFDRLWFEAMRASGEYHRRCELNFFKRPLNSRQEGWPPLFLSEYQGSHSEHYKLTKNSQSQLLLRRRTETSVFQEVQSAELFGGMHITSCRTILPLRAILLPKQVYLVEWHESWLMFRSRFQDMRILGFVLTREGIVPRWLRMELMMGHPQSLRVVIAWSHATLFITTPISKSTKFLRSTSGTSPATATFP